MVPYSLFTSVTHFLVIGYTLTVLAPLGLRRTLRPLVAALADPDAAYRAAMDTATAECERLEAALGTLDVRIMAAESEVGIRRVRREHEEEEKRERPVSEPDSGIGMGDDEGRFAGEEQASESLMSSIHQEQLEGAANVVADGEAKPRLPKLVIPAETNSASVSANDADAAELAAVRALSPTLATSSLTFPHPSSDIPTSPISRTPSTDLAQHIHRSITPLSTHPSSLPRSAPSSRRRTVSSPDALPTATSSPSSSTSQVESRAARRVRDMHRSRTGLHAALANARAALARVPAHFTYRRGWIARARAAAALAVLVGGLTSAAACSLGFGRCLALSLFCASSVLVCVVVCGLVGSVTGEQGQGSRAAVLGRVLRMVVVCGAMGEAVEVVVLGPWAACGRLAGWAGWGGWLGEMVVPAVLVGGFWMRVGLAVKEVVVGTGWWRPKAE